MIALPAGISAELAKSFAPNLRIHLLDVQLGNGSNFFWSDFEGAFLSRLTGAVEQYKPWIKQPPTIKRTRSLNADGGNFSLQNLTGNTIEREVAKLFRDREFEGAYIIYRRWLAPLDASYFEFHGFITEQSVEDEEITFNMLQLFQPNDVKAYDSIQTRDCNWRFGSAQCGHRRGRLFVPLTLATTFGANTIGSSALAMTPNLFKDEMVMIVHGTGLGEEGYILSHTATTFTMKANWAMAPDGSSEFIVTGPGTLRVYSTTDIFSSSTIGSASLSQTVNGDVDCAVFIIAGTGAGQNRGIASNTATTFTIAPAWTTAPDATSIFVAVHRDCSQDYDACTARGLLERFRGIIFLQPQITGSIGPTGIGPGGNPDPGEGPGGRRKILV